MYVVMAVDESGQMVLHGVWESALEAGEWLAGQAKFGLSGVVVPVQEVD